MINDYQQKVIIYRIGAAIDTDLTRKRDPARMVNDEMIV